MADMADELVKMLLYFDVFSYPLTKGEIISYCGIGSGSRHVADHILAGLKERGVVSCYRGYYYLGNRKSIVSRRIEGNRRAAGRMRDAVRYSRIIAAFPFIRGVFLSGSISKGYMSADDDIDYFIVTEPGRLWLARTFLTLFKKIFLFNSHKNFCINYFVDTKHLLIAEQNRYTATEVVFLIPVFNSLLYDRIIEQNSWVKAWYPEFVQGHDLCNDRHFPVKTFIEKLLGKTLGDGLENICFKSSQSWIRRKYLHMASDNFRENFIIRHHELRYLPNRQQPEILRKYYASIRQFEKDTGVMIKEDTGINDKYRPG
jgi:hypothetical protein